MAMRLCPIYPGWYLYVLATACRLLSRNEFAISTFEEAIDRNADNLGLHVGRASTLGELGREEDAKKPVSEILRLNPDIAIKKYSGELSYRDPAELARFEDGLRKAGLPESSYIDAHVVLGSRCSPDTGHETVRFGQGRLVVL